MSLMPRSTGPSEPLARDHGLEVLDACHREMLAALGKLALIVEDLEHHEADPQARAEVGAIVEFFSTTVHQHHLDEERHVFSKLLESGDPQIVHTVVRLQQDHHWMDVDWRELSPLLEAVAAGRGGYDPDTLREWVEVFTLLSREHIALEETCIYPEARARLQAADLSERDQGIAQRRHNRRRGGSGG